MGGMDDPRSDRRGDRARRARATGRVRGVPRARDAREAGRDRRRDLRRPARTRARRRLERGRVPGVRVLVRSAGLAVRGVVRGDPSARRRRTGHDARQARAGGRRRVAAPAGAEAPADDRQHGSAGAHRHTPHVDAWNTWFDWYGNSPEGFATRNTEIDAIAREVGRDPAEIERSACLLVALDPTTRERPLDPSAPPVTGSPAAIAETIDALGAAGADEVILVVDPITERSIETLGGALVLRH